MVMIFFALSVFFSLPASVRHGELSIHLPDGNYYSNYSKSANLYATNDEKIMKVGAHTNKPDEPSKIGR